MFAGDTNTAYDPSGHLLIVLEGNFEIEPVTPEQWASLQRLTVAAARRWGIGPDRIAGHRDYTPTLCPGEGLHRLLPQLKRRVAR
jgi:N-acetyl-anhydromuramyl-L-alanine amidase AmpD